MQKSLMATVSLLAVSARREGGMCIDPECWHLPHKHQNMKGGDLAYSNRKCDCERRLTGEMCAAARDVRTGRVQASGDRGGIGAWSEKRERE